MWVSRQGLQLSFGFQGNVQATPALSKFDLDNSSRLTISAVLNDWYYGIICVVPVMNIRVESVSEQFVVELRFEVCPSIDGLIRLCCN